MQIDAAVREVCERTFEDLVSLQSVQDLRAVYSAIASHWFCPSDVEQEAFLRAIQATETAGFTTARNEQGIKLGQRHVQRIEALKETAMMDEPIAAIEGDNASSLTETSTRSESKPKVRHRRKPLSVDPDRLRTVAAAFGIDIRGKGGAGGLSYEAALGQVLEQLAQGHAPVVSPSMPETPQDEGAISAIKDQAKTLAWLTGRMETLDQQVEQLKQERDEAIHQVQQAGDSAQVQQLQLENQRLREERDEANSKLQTFRQLLMGTERQPEEQQAEGENTQRMETAINPAATLPSTADPELPKPARKRRSEADPLEPIRRAIQAIMALNDQEGKPFDAKWYISFPVVQSLLRANNLSANQKNVAAVFEEMKQELEHHHDKHAIGSRHNRRHPNVEKIKDLVSLSQ